MLMLSYLVEFTILFQLNLTVMFWITGTLMSGWVFRQKVRMETQMKNTEEIPIL